MRRLRRAGITVRTLHRSQHCPSATGCALLPCWSLIVLLHIVHSNGTVSCVELYSGDSPSIDVVELCELVEVVLRLIVLLLLLVPMRAANCRVVSLRLVPVEMANSPLSPLIVGSGVVVVVAVGWQLSAVGATVVIVPVVVVVLVPFPK